MGAEGVHSCITSGLLVVSDGLLFSSERSSNQPYNIHITIYIIYHAKLRSLPGMKKRKLSKAL